MKRVLLIVFCLAIMNITAFAQDKGFRSIQIFIYNYTNDQVTVMEAENKEGTWIKDQQPKFGTMILPDDGLYAGIMTNDEESSVGGILKLGSEDDPITITFYNKPNGEKNVKAEGNKGIKVRVVNVFTGDKQHVEFNVHLLIRQ